MYTRSNGFTNGVNLRQPQKPGGQESEPWNAANQARIKRVPEGFRGTGIVLRGLVQEFDPRTVFRLLDDPAVTGRLVLHS